MGLGQGGLAAGPPRTSPLVPKWDYTSVQFFDRILIQSHKISQTSISFVVLFFFGQVTARLLRPERVSSQHYSAPKTSRKKSKLSRDTFLVAFCGPCDTSDWYGRLREPNSTKLVPKNSKPNWSSMYISFVDFGSKSRQH